MCTHQDCRSLSSSSLLRFVLLQALSHGKYGISESGLAAMSMALYSHSVLSKPIPSKYAGAWIQPAKKHAAWPHPSSNRALLHSREAGSEAAKSRSTLGRVEFPGPEPSSRSSGLGFAGNSATELVASATASMFAVPNNAFPSRPGMSRSVKPPVHSDARPLRAMSNAEPQSGQGGGELCSVGRPNTTPVIGSGDLLMRLCHARTPGR